MMEERESRKEVRSVSEQRAMGQEEMMPGNVTQMAGAAYRPFWFSRVHWGSVIGGAVVGLSSWLLLNAIGYAVGFGITSVSSIADLRSVGLGVLIWTGISAVIAWLIGGYAASRFARVQLASDGLWYGVAVWAFISIISLVLGTFILSGLLAFITNWISAGLGIPNTADVSAGGIQNVASVTAGIALYILLGSLLGLTGSLLGGWLGSRRLSMAEAAREERERVRMAA